jgi:hypothetical protein
MDSLGDAIEDVERRRKTVVAYTTDDAVAEELKTQFSTRNVRVSRRVIPASGGPGFVVVRDAGGEFQGAVSVDNLQAILSPEIHPPWTLEGTGADLTEVFDFLDNTVFTSYDRRQMLATSREIEERAWRRGTGRLVVGFQRSTAFAAQLPVYDRFGAETDVAVRIYIDDEWDGDSNEHIHVQSVVGGEIGQYWFVAFDGGESDLEACALLAEER